MDAEDCISHVFVRDKVCTALLRQNNKAPEQLGKSDQSHKYKVQDLLLSRGLVSVSCLYSRESSGEAVASRKCLLVELLKLCLSNILTTLP